MLEITLPIIAILSAILALIVVFSHARKELNHWSLCTCLLFLGLLEGFDLLSLQHLVDHEFYKTASLLVEACFPACWLFYVLTLQKHKRFRAFSGQIQLLVVSAAFLPLLVLYLRYPGFFYSPDFAEEKVLFVESAGFYFYLVLIAYQAVAIYYIEQALVSSPPVSRRQFLYELLGCLLIVAVMIFYQSQALLHRTIDMNLLPARSLAVAIGAAMIGFSRFRRQQGINMQISQHVAFRSTALLAVGLYLVVLGAIGEGLRYVGLHDRRQIYAVIGVLIGILLLFFLSSEKQRRRTKVLLYKHFYRQKYDYRQEWLKFTASISSATSFIALQEAILASYCETFARSGATLYLLDHDGKCYRRSAVMGSSSKVEHFDADSLLIKSMLSSNWVFNVNDKHTGDLMACVELLQRNDIYLCVPLRFEDNLHGFIALANSINPGEQLIYEDYDLMKVLANQATSSLLSIKLSSQLFSAQEMAVIGKVSTFIMHDLKNHVTNLSLILSNAKDYIADPEFQSEMLETLSGTLVKMKNLILRLQKIGDKAALDISPCDLLDIARQGAQSAGLPVEVVRGKCVPVAVDREELEKVVINLLANAKESGSTVDDLVLEVGHDDQAYLKVSDKGCGMTEDFIRDSLFKPFKSTKQRGFGIGLYQCRQIVEAHFGRIEVQSTAGAGTTFTVWLPKAAEAIEE